MQPSASAFTVEPTILGEVIGLEHCITIGPCVLGQPTRSPSGPLVLGPGTVIRAYAVLYQGATLGAGVQVGHGVLIREGNILGDHVSIGSGTQLEPGNRIGDRSRIHSGCFLASASIGKDVFVGPHVTFTDDPHPPCPDWPRCCSGVVVEDEVSIGGNSTLMPGVILHRGALVGGGSVVTRDVDAGVIVAGNPARPRGRRSDLTCAGPRRRPAIALGDGR